MRFQVLFWTGMIECRKFESSPFAFSEPVVAEPPNPLSHRYHVIHIVVSKQEHLKFNTAPSYYPSPEIVMQNFAKRVTDLQFGKERVIEVKTKRCNRFEMQFIYAVPN